MADNSGEKKTVQPSTPHEGEKRQYVPPSVTRLEPFKATSTGKPRPIEAGRGQGPTSQ